MSPPQLCPSCNAGYIKYSGLGTEKIESELARLFPQANIKRQDEPESPGDFKDADIFVSSQRIIKEPDLKFDLIVAMAIDNYLNRVDFRAAEKTFGVLTGLLGLTSGKLVVETYLTTHHCFRALESKDAVIFYDEELKHRKELNFPPYRHLGLVKLRGKNMPKVMEVSELLFKELGKKNKGKGIKLISLNPAGHPKLRSNFYWQILLSSVSPKRLSGFLKINLKDFRHSGIIVTVDIDPI